MVKAMLKCKEDCLNYKKGDVVRSEVFYHYEGAEFWVNLIKKNCVIDGENYFDDAYEVVIEKRC